MDRQGTVISSSVNRMANDVVLGVGNCAFLVRDKPASCLRFLYLITPNELISRPIDTFERFTDVSAIAYYLLSYSRTSVSLLAHYFIS